MRFAPRLTPADFKAFFCGPEGWGTLRQTRDGATQRDEVIVVQGQLAVAKLRLVPAGKAQKVAVTLDGAALAAEVKSAGEELLVSLKEPAIIKAGKTLVVVIG